MKKIIYLDNAATTPVAREVEKDIVRNIHVYGNPSSIHFKGEEAKKKIEECREKIASYIGVEKEEIIFTSGATESNNMIIRGFAKKNKEKRKILVSSIEHPSVLESAYSLEKEGFLVEKIRVNKEGILDLDDLKSKIDDKTLLVSVMHVNNEIGTIQPIEDIAKICRQKRVFFHSDMVQSFTKLDINLKKIGLDFASFSGHKINALKGIGLVYIKKGIEIEPLILGGGQEKGFRSGTENLLGVVSLAAALKIRRNKEKIKKQRDFILREILKLGGVKLNGSLNKRIYNNINVSFYGLEGESIALALSEKGICVSTGSACSSHKLSHSHVLEAIGTEPLYLNGAIRITISELKESEINYFLRSLKEVIEKLKKISLFK
ncbi:MAG: cysteine desulfurase family protein [Candidatus Pacearchaeota archaeon]